MTRAQQVVKRLLEEKDFDLVHRTPGVCGGSACIRGRIPVWAVMRLAQQGSTDDIRRAYPDVTEQDIRAAFDYARQHPEEIERDAVENENA